MTARRPTGSTLHRTLRCPASAVLPWDTDERMEAARAPACGRGTAIHGYLELVKQLGPEEAIARIGDPEIAAFCRALDLTNLPTHLATEVAMAWNWRTRTARFLGKNLGHRDYARLTDPPTADEIPFTADAIGANTGSADTVHLGYVGDYKTGHTRYPRPGSFGQTLIAACAARQLLPCHEVIVELLYLDDHGACFPVRDRVDGWALDAFEAEVAEAMESLPALHALYAQGAEPAARAGDHCAHCGAYRHCSANVGLARHLPEALAQIGIAGPPDAIARRPVITPAIAGSLYPQIERLEALIAEVKAEIHALAWHAPLALPDGRVLDRVERTARAVDAQIAFAVLEARYDRTTAMGATDFKITLDAIRKAVADHLDPAVKPRQTVEGKHGIFPQVLAEIDRRGGIKTTTSTFVRPVTPKRKALP